MIGCTIMSHEYMLMMLQEQFILFIAVLWICEVLYIYLLMYYKIIPSVQ